MSFFEMHVKMIDNKVVLFIDMQNISKYIHDYYNLSNTSISQELKNLIYSIGWSPVNDEYTPTKINFNFSELQTLKIKCEYNENNNRENNRENVLIELRCSKTPFQPYIFIDEAVTVTNDNEIKFMKDNSHQILLTETNTNSLTDEFYSKVNEAINCDEVKRLLKQDKLEINNIDKLTEELLRNIFLKIFKKIAILDVLEDLYSKSIMINDLNNQDNIQEKPSGKKKILKH